MISLVEDRIKLESKEDLLKVHIMIKCFEKGVTLSMAEIGVLAELHVLGYGEPFYSSCVNKGYFKTKQTVRNAVSRMGELEILESKKRGQRSINPDYLPAVTADKVLFRYLVSNL